MTIVHLTRGEVTDDGFRVAWCDVEVGPSGHAFATPELVTCEPCLEAAADYGGQVARRLVHIRYAKMRGLAP